MAAIDEEVKADASLVVAARAGDRDAFGVLVDRHRPVALALARRLLGEPALAADAVQEAAAAALVGLGRLRSPERFGAWFAAIALNVGRRWLRELARSLPAAPEPVDVGPGPEEQAEAADLARRVRHAVAGLPTGQRDAILAFYWQGLGHAEAAAELGIRPGAVKARLHQARVALAPQLSPLAQSSEEEPALTSTAESAWVEVAVVEVRRSADTDAGARPHVVVLEERGGTRRLPIYVGAPEATALALSLESVEMPRPMTYQMASALVEASGSRVLEVRITRLAESTFYALVALDGPAGRSEVDARPSDALNLALVTGVPIRVDAALFGLPQATWHTAWEQYPTGAAELVAEVRQRQAEQMALLTQESQEEPGH